MAVREVEHNALATKLFDVGRAVMPVLVQARVGIPLHARMVSFQACGQL